MPRSTDNSPASRLTRSERPPRASSSNLAHSPSPQHRLQPNKSAGNGAAKMRVTRSVTFDLANGATAAGEDESDSKGGRSLRRRRRVDYARDDIQAPETSTPKPKQPSSSRARKRRAKETPPPAAQKRRKTTADWSPATASEHGSDHRVMDEIQVATESPEEVSDTSYHDASAGETSPQNGAESSLKPPTTTSTPGESPNSGSPETRRRVADHYERLWENYDPEKDGDEGDWESKHDTRGDSPWKDINRTKKQNYLPRWFSNLPPPNPIRQGTIEVSTRRDPGIFPRKSVLVKLYPGSDICARSQPGTAFAYFHKKGREMERERDQHKESDRPTTQSPSPSEPSSSSVLATANEDRGPEKEPTPSPAHEPLLKTPDVAVESTTCTTTTTSTTTQAQSISIKEPAIYPMDEEGNVLSQNESRDFPDSSSEESALGKANNTATQGASVNNPTNIGSSADSIARHSSTSPAATNDPTLLYPVMPAGIRRILQGSTEAASSLYTSTSPSSRQHNVASPNKTPTPPESGSLMDHNVTKVSEPTSEPTPAETAALDLASPMEETSDEVQKSISSHDTNEQEPYPVHQSDADNISGSQARDTHEGIDSQAPETVVEVDESEVYDGIMTQGPWSSLTPYLADKVLYPEVDETRESTPVSDQADREGSALEGVTLPDALNIKANQKPKQFSFKKLRPAEEFIDAISDYKSMSTDDLFSVLATINDTMCVWQDEYVEHRKTIDAEFNAPRRKANELKEDDRIARDLERFKTQGVYDLETIEGSTKQGPKGFQLRRTLEPRKWYVEVDKDGDQVRADARANDKVMAQAYGFEYDSRDQMIGKQAPLDQRDGPNKPRTRARPKSLKATEAAAEDHILTGKRIRKRRVLDDESLGPSRTNTPVPATAAPPKRRRRTAAEIAADNAAAAAASAAAAAEAEENNADKVSGNTAPAEATKTGRGRRTKAPNSVLPNSSQESQPPSDEPTRKRRRGAAGVNGDAEQRPSEEPTGSEETVLDSSQPTAEKEVSEPSPKRRRKAPAHQPARGEIASGSFYNSAPVQAPVEQQPQESRPSTSSSNATVISTGSNYGFRPNRVRNFREMEEGRIIGSPTQEPPKKKRVRRKNNDATPLAAPKNNDAPIQPVPLPPMQLAPGHGHPPHHDVQYEMMHQPPQRFENYTNSYSQHGAFGIMNLGPPGLTMPPAAPPNHGQHLHSQHLDGPHAGFPPIIPPPHQLHSSGMPFTAVHASLGPRGAREFKIKNVTPSMVHGTAGSGGPRAGGGSRPPSAPRGSTSASGGSAGASRANSPAVGANGDDPMRNYATMTKSEKMSASMKSRWQNGSMQGAVEKRRKTLALKKERAREAAAAEAAAAAAAAASGQSDNAIQLPTDIAPAPVPGGGGAVGK